MPVTTEMPMISFITVSLLKCRSIQRSRREGSLPSSSGKNSADHIRAFTPSTMEARKFTTPRRKGTPRMG